MIKKIFQPRLKLLPGTRLTSLLFVGASVLIAGAILFAANIYYNLDTGEIVMEEVQRAAQLIKATAGLIVGGTANQNPASGYGFEVATSSLFSAGNVVLSAANQELRFTGGTGNYIGIRATSTLSYTLTYTLPTSPPTASNFVLTATPDGQMAWSSVSGAGGIIQVGNAIGTNTGGLAFTSNAGTQYGNILWFHPNANYTMALMAADSGLTANATTVIPAVSGTNYLTVTPGALTQGQVLLATGNYTLGGNANLTWNSGNLALVVGSSNNRGQLRLYSNNANYLAFTPTTSLASTVTYTWPAAPSGSGYVLTSDTSGNLSWVAAGTGGIGDITAVGDCASGDCFTQTGGTGNNLWFITGGGGRIQLTGASTDSNQTITLPAATGYVALGTSTANYVAYWTGTNTLAGEQYLSTSRGGIGADSSGWSGMVRVVGGSWGAVQGTAGYAAYWSDANTVAAEQYLAVSRGGTGRGSWTQWGVLYADGTTSLNNTGAGSTYQILTANTGAAPTWRNISELITAANGLTATGTAQLTLKLGGTLTENTTINLSNYNLLFNLTSGGTSEKFAVQVGGSDILVVNDQGQILYKNYPLAQTGKQVLREMVPIFGFDLPVKTATTSYVQISRTIVNYPLNPCESGASRVHKLVIRYGATATSTWQVATSTTGGYAELTVPPTGATSTGSVYTIQTDIPTPSGSCTDWTQGTETDDWWVRMKLNDTGEIMIYQIFLAGYDEIQ